MSGHFRRQRQAEVARGSPSGAAFGGFWCARHGRGVGGASPLWSLMGATMNRRQLRDVRNRQPGGRERGRTAQVGSVRSREMEADSAALDRAQAKLRKAVETRVSVPDDAKPDTHPGSGGSGDGVVRNSAHLTRGDLLVSPSTPRGRRVERKDCPPMHQEKSDRLIRAKMPGNAGGAKEATK